MSCDEPHDNEVILTYEFSDTQFTSDEMIWDHMDQIRTGAWPDHVGIAYADSALVLLLLAVRGRLECGQPDWSVRGL